MKNVQRDSTYYDTVIAALRDEKREMIEVFQEDARKIEEKYTLEELKESGLFVENVVCFGKWDTSISYDVMRCFVYPTIEVDVVYENDYQGASTYDHTYTSIRYYKPIGELDELAEIRRDLMKIEGTIDCGETILEREIEKHKKCLDEQEKLFQKLKELQDGHI